MDILGIVGAGTGLVGAALGFSATLRAARIAEVSQRRETRREVYADFILLSRKAASLAYSCARIGEFSDSRWQDLYEMVKQLDEGRTRMQLEGPEAVRDAALGVYRHLSSWHAALTRLRNGDGDGAQLLGAFR